MTARDRRMLAAALVIALGFLAWTAFRGNGPLAAHDAPTAPSATKSTPAPTGAGSAAASGATGTAAPGTTPASAAPAAKATTTGVTPTANTPLSGALSEPNRAGFERTTVKLANLEHTVAAPIGPMVTEAKKACATLDRAVPLQKALHGTCRDTIAVAKLTRALANRCTAPSAPCARTSLRLAAASTNLAAARRRYARVIRAEVPPGTCRAAISPTHDQLAALSASADALQRVARASAANDADAFASAGAALGQASHELYQRDARPAAVIITAFRTACHIQRYPDPIG